MFLFISSTLFVRALTITSVFALATLVLVSIVTNFKPLYILGYKAHFTFHNTGNQITGDNVLFTSYSRYGIPIYADQGRKSSPSIVKNSSLTWGDDAESPISNTTAGAGVEHPRLFAPPYKWNRLPALITVDPYLASWNKTIFERASKFKSLPPTNYSLDGPLNGNGVLDVAREVQLKIKHWAYAYRMSNSTGWKDRIWEEILVVSGNSTQYFGATGDNWNSQHWLDVGEFIIAFSIAYDWLYDAWDNTQREAIMWSIISLGLQKGIEAYDRNMWFLSVNGNWNCVTNGGMIIGSLAIYNEDPTGISSKLLALSVPNAEQNCAWAVQSDGTWTETPDYWYFGTQAHAQIASALLTATGDAQQMLTINPALKSTGLFHIFNYGLTQKFNYGDCGPPKFTATANSLLFYGDQYQFPMYSLYQRDQLDAPDPLSMFWYNPEVTGAWFEGLPLDKSFPDANDAWVSMRSTWTEPTGLFVAMKSGNMTGHSTHGNIDAGDFVLDAMGERWAGELCQDNYLSTGYFSSESQDSDRWLYYRCRTEGQNTIVYNGSNQVVNVVSHTLFSSTGTVQTGTKFEADEKSTAFWIADLTSAYNGTVLKRGLRLLNGRKQVLIQDEITNGAAMSQWRMHTNATVAYSKDNKTAHLALNGKFLDIILQSPETAIFRTLQPYRLPGDPPLPENETDMPNLGVSVLTIDIPPGSETIAVVFSPMWGHTWKTMVPPLVALERWSLTSHNAS